VDLGDVILDLRSRNQPVPRPIRLPKESEVREFEDHLGLQFHPDYRRYLLEASDVVFGTLEPVTITRPESHTHLPLVVSDARAMGVPDDLLPICEDNGDYFCVDVVGTVRYWSHNGATDESWPTVAQWIHDVWIGENT